MVRAGPGGAVAGKVAGQIRAGRGLGRNRDGRGGGGLRPETRRGPGPGRGGEL